MTSLAPTPTPSSPSRKRGCLWVVLALVVLMVIGAGLAALVAAALGRGLSGLPTRSKTASWGADEFPALNEVWAYGQGDSKAVIVPIQGFIGLDESGGLFGPTRGPGQLALMAIRRATRDPEVRAIILDVDSGGGGITASDVLYQALLDFRLYQEGRVVVAIFGDVAASGAYYVSLAADHILARPTSITGSIGVLMQTLNLRELGARIGVRDVTIKSGENKDLLNPLQELSESQRVMLQGIVDDLHTRFVGLVAERRGLPEADVRRLADGRIITAAQAVEAGLVDEIGYWDDALQAAADLLEADAVKAYRYEEAFSFYSLFRAMQTWTPPLADWPERVGRTRLLYQWQL